MPELKQYVVECREDWWPILRGMCKAFSVVMEAGEKQRIAKGLDPNAWMTANSQERFNHVLHHTLCTHHRGLNALTPDTSLYERWHAMVGLGIVEYHESLDAPAGLVIETLDEE